MHQNEMLVTNAFKKFKFLILVNLPPVVFLQIV